MEKSRPDQNPGYQTIWKVTLLSCMSLTFGLEVWNFLEEQYRPNNREWYAILGVAYGISSIVGAVAGDIVSKRRQSLTETASISTLLLVPLQFQFYRLVKQQETGVLTYTSGDFAVALFCITLSGLGQGGLLTATTGYISKQATSLTPGLQFGHWSMAMSAAYFYQFLWHYFTCWDLQLTIWGGILTAASAGFWWMMDEVQVDQENKYEERDLQVILQKNNGVRFLAFAIVATAFEWGVEEMLEDRALHNEITRVGFFLTFVAALGASILFGFGFDKRPSMIIRIWLIVSIVAFCLYYAVWNYSAVYVLFAVIKMTMANIGCKCFFLSWLCTQNKKDTISACAAWWVLWYVAWLLTFVFCELFNGSDYRQVVFVYVAVALIYSAFQVSTWNFSHENDIFKRNKVHVDDPEYGNVSDDDDE